jgi:tetratricopeptide (TPR) repeat protein
VGLTNFLKRLFGRPGEPAGNDLPDAGGKPAASSSTPANDELLIHFFDEYGRQMQIEREVWRKDVLPLNLQQQWNHSDGLYGLIVQSLNDGLAADVVAAAEQLARIDAQPARGAMILGVVYIENGRLDEAQRVLEEQLARHGDDGYVLANLAKVYDQQGDAQRAEATLWHALEVDPNQEFALGWYQAICRERGGEPGALEAFRRVAARAGSWRAQLCLAHEALQRNDWAEALRQYTESLTRAGRPTPEELLMQLSGDLGKQGRLRELVTLTAPRFEAARHGLRVGNNLIKAYVELEEYQEASRIVEELFAQQRPDWKTMLAFWEGEIADRQGNYGPVEEAGPLQVALLTLAGPLWARVERAPGQLFPKGAESVVICCQAATVQMDASRTTMERQKPDASGRFTRVAPLFLVEQIHARTDATGVMLLPWLIGNGFMVSGTRWPDDDAASNALQGEPKGDFVLTMHVDPTRDPWQLEARLIRAINAECVATLQATFAAANPELGLIDFAERVLGLVTEHCGAQRWQPEFAYEPPVGESFAHYALRLDQGLAVAASQLAKSEERFLFGEREILDGVIHLCLDQISNAVVRLLMAETCRLMKQARPKIVAEYSARLLKLHNAHPLEPRIQTLVQEILDEALGDEKV